MKKKIKSLFSYIIADNEDFSLEDRLILSAIIVGIITSITGSIINLLLTTSVTAVVIPILLSVMLLVLYYFMRFKKIFKPFVKPTIGLSFIGVSIIWLSNGGLNGSNILFALVVLILSLVAVSDSTKIYVLLVFLSVTLFVYLIQFFRPDMITSFPTEKERWLDAAISLIYASVFIFLIIKYLHKHYTLERIKVEESEKKLMQLNADKDQFISILAHDLRSPFNAILGYLDLLKSNVYTYDNKTIENQLTIIQNSAQNTYQLLEDVLFWATAQSGKTSFEPYKLNLSKILPAIIEVHKTNAVVKDINITLKSTDNLFILADLNMLKAIIRNLISNAIKFTKQGGEIEISANKADSGVVIEVKDNGIGMSEEAINKLWDFSNLQTTRGTLGEKGSGLGLNLSKDFVNKHNGRIWVESEIDKGTVFYIFFPDQEFS